MRAVPVGVTVAHDDVADAGPLAGAIAGLGALPAAIEVVLIVGGDMPTLRPAVLELLVRTVGDDPAIAAAVLDAGGPMPMAVRRDVAARTAGNLFAGGERRLRALPERLAATVIPASAWRVIDSDAATIRDIDRPSDLPNVLPTDAPDAPRD